MDKKIKISSDPINLSINELQVLARSLKIEDWQEKDRKELVKVIEDIAVYDQKKAQIENIIGAAPEGFKSLGQLWFEFFQKSKVWTSVITVIVGIIVALSITYLDNERDSIKKNNELKNLDVVTQINNLNTVEGNLEDLLDFIKHQRTSLNATESKIQALTKEKDQLEPIVNANREVIQAIFQQQEENKKKGVFIERLIGFGLGVLGSIVASIIFNLFRRKKIVRENNVS
ncbi:hypothetical protein H2O64_03955 [Kordia sp. YSTF-M3]|uniref:Uncharacterized protein n=1 Tax=Kordia aestuariivivens TaxID=2759037 RepID=A0ABR7Q5G9_9FLAO|nr:hypothetical protein [Kordia aestuariivivens]MBC8753809.1 hypothetical protein [Kordia aestuariivivens]